MVEFRRPVTRKEKRIFARQVASTMPWTETARGTILQWLEHPDVEITRRLYPISTAYLATEISEQLGLLWEVSARLAPNYTMGMIELFAAWLLTEEGDVTPPPIKKLDRADRALLKDVLPPGASVPRTTARLSSKAAVVLDAAKENHDVEEETNVAGLQDDRPGVRQVAQGSSGAQPAEGRSRFRRRDVDARKGKRPRAGNQR